MTDYSELRRLAHDASETEMDWLDRDWLSGIMADDWADYVAAIDPQVVIDLIDESANARRTGAHWKDEKICADAVIVQLKAENDAMRTALEKISAYAPCSGIKDPGFTKMHMGILARDAIAAAMSQGEQS